MTKGVRTVLIIVALAAIVWAVPSGGDGANAVGTLLSTIILAAFVLLGVRVYRETRSRVELLGDAHRILLYGSLGVLVVAMAARPSLVDTGAGTVLFVVLVAMPFAALYAVYQRWREVG